MRKILLLVSLFMGSTLFTIAQDHGSCDKAFLVDTSVCGPVYADGLANPLLATKHTDGSYFEKPHIAVWFCIDIPYDTLLTFDLVPQTPTDDLDFLLFKDETAETKNCGLCRVDRKNFCQKIAMEKMFPVRTNIANTVMSVKGMTGLSANAENETEPPGKHSTYSKALPVKKGERYYLVVDNYTSAKRPFILVLHFSFDTDTDYIVAQSKETILPVHAANGLFNINVFDSTTGKPIKANIRIDWVNPEGKAKVETVGKEYSFSLKRAEKINVVCYTKGYLIDQRTYTALSDSDKGIEIKLIRIKAHTKMIFKHLEFKPGLAEFLPSASESLNDLLDFMTNNPDVHIMIKGFVNDPYKLYDNKFDLTLSSERAAAVYNYLLDKGIAKNRIQYRGYGASQMVYPEPSNEDEMEANRRVEVEIVK
ncbi:MAG TPA: OmpA family protein [Bacteroidia bacterium]|jgi:outer membrane protein OmpA-like peptidoglycan-associated protein|nr:OmpA family protein [Bacteroidia bacterium]